MQRVLVCGGRSYSDRWHLYDILDVAHSAHPIGLIIHGGAMGADRLAQSWAVGRGVPCKAYPAEWAKYGKSAGPTRNQMMIDLEKPNLVIAFPGGKGTADVVKRAEAAKIPIFRV